jgi:hypothetical protein
MLVTCSFVVGKLVLSCVGDFSGTSCRGLPAKYPMVLHVLAEVGSLVFVQAADRSRLAPALVMRGSGVVFCDHVAGLSL